MGRAIKFRGLSEHGWRYIDLTDSSGFSRELLELMAKDDLAFNWKTPLEQFTGLRDKNGKEIYEGDILSVVEFKAPIVVGWKESHATFVLRKNGWMYDHYFGQGAEAEQCEVIGNIHENAELLKSS